MKPMYVAIIGFLCGVLAALLGLTFIALVGLQAEDPSASAPAFVDYPELPAQNDDESYKSMSLSPEQQQAVQHAYEMIDKVEQADAGRKGE